MFRILFVFLLLMFVSFMPHSVYGLEVEGVEVSGTSSVDFLTHYMWRGQQLSDKAVIQPVVEITYGGFGFNYWSNYDLHTAEVTETDYTPFYNFQVGKFDFTLGGIYYAFNEADDTFEFFTSVGYDTFLSPAISAYFDVDEGSGTWLAATIGHSFDLPYGLALNLGALVSYNIHHNLVGVDENGNPFSSFSNAEYSMSLSIPIWKAISIEPKMAYTHALDDESRTGFESFSVDPGDKTDSKLYGGFAVSVSF